jgi:hypothetical protein
MLMNINLPNPFSIIWWNLKAIIIKSYFSSMIKKILAFWLRSETESDEVYMTWALII